MISLSINDSEKIGVDGVDVYCATGNVDECRRWGRTLSRATGILGGMINKELKILVVVTSGMQVLMLSAFEVLRKYDGITAIDVTQPLPRNLYNALHSIAELAIRKDFGSTVSRWALEGLASALALEALKASDEDAFREILGSVSSEKCVGLSDLYSWKFPVEVGEGFTVIGGSGGDTAEAVKRLISTLTKSLEGDIIGHVSGGEKAFYSTAARLFYRLINKYGVPEIYRLLTDEDTLRKRVEGVYEEACSAT
ncbi:MAG: hypothetical protein GSR87_00025 [Desulfurococcales archaeon]|nr:hypothetical protein [Desulfurococcales archaeon]